MADQDARKGSATSGGGGRKRSGKKPGRPGLSDDAKSSPQIAFRVAPPIRQKAKEVADREGLTVSQLSRKALRQYLEGSGSTK